MSPFFFFTWSITTSVFGKHRTTPNFFRNYELPSSGRQKKRKPHLSFWYWVRSYFGVWKGVSANVKSHFDARSFQVGIIHRLVTSGEWNSHIPRPSMTELPKRTILCTMTAPFSDGWQYFCFFWIYLGSYALKEWRELWTKPTARRCSTTMRPDIVKKW